MGIAYSNGFVLCTAMRRGELLNLTWRDVNFDRMVVEVAHKDNSESAWE